MQLLGIFGHPIGHSLSPHMHQEALKATGLEDRFVYIPFDILPGQLSSAVSAIRVLNMRGVNVTIPYKENVISLIDELDDQAYQTGAVNVIINDQGKLKGYNTDGTGFIRSLRERGSIDPGGKKILLFGAGGASRGVAAALSRVGAKKICIVNRSEKRAFSVADLVKSMGVEVKIVGYESEALAGEIDTAHIIINTTPVGMLPDNRSPMEGLMHFLHQGQLVCDIVYNPLRTTLLKEAEMQGCRTLDGLGMLLYQGAEAFTLWTGIDAPVDIMSRALEEKLSIAIR